MNKRTAEKLRAHSLGQRQELLLRNPSLSDPQPTQRASDALDAATAPAADPNAEAPPLREQRRSQSLNDHHPDKGSDMGNQPSIPSVTETPMPGEEPAFDIDNLLLRCVGTGAFYTPALTAAEARHTARGSWVFRASGGDPA
ncbi:hypothetical protein [Arthrobacter sp. ISL-5]|uniref:hypothetical protein n=1 Tax=Arthrobacter sp. ISL-5 TaxID=2819111 RepID=UPI001BE94680|nr:hypothetical protein [Arthrobacter sp. ISL-5]MBT2555838.1 hypothetical protein [Arthrobacter sp. ISL-5]